MVKGGYQPANTNMLLETPYPGNILFFCYLFILKYEEWRNVKIQADRVQKLKMVLEKDSEESFPSRINCTMLCFVGMKNLFVLANIEFANQIFFDPCSAIKRGDEWIACYLMVCVRRITLSIYVEWF